MRNLSLFCGWLLALSAPAYAQIGPAFSLAPELFPVLNSEGDTLQNPWVGGVNSVQFGRVDFNRDGRLDLAGYDRYTGQTHAWLAMGGGWKWSPEHAAPLAERTESWALFADATGDGLPDLFTAHPSGIRIYANTEEADGTTGWEPVFTDEGQYFLQAESPNGLVNIQVSRTDVIGLLDEDGDGDVDLWVFNFATGETVNYYRNMSLERTGNVDALLFERVTNYWGGLSDCGCGLVALDSLLCRPEGVEHAGGKSIMMVPEMGQGASFVFGDELCTEPQWITNAGTAAHPDLNRSPIGDSLVGWTPLSFPSGYLLDEQTMAFSSNLTEDVVRATDFSQSVHHYGRAEGGWRLLETNWLQGDMVDVGAEAMPAWTDLGRDGSPDLLLAQAGPGPGLHVFRNLGTWADPMLQYDTAYWPDSALVDWHVWVTNLTGDLYDEVLVAGRDPVRTSFIFYYAEVGDDGSLGNWQPWSFPLSTGESVIFYDLGRDGQLDALLGSPSGRITRWRNRGTATEPDWHADVASYLGLDNSSERIFPRLSLGDLNGNGSLDLLITARSRPAVWVSSVTETTIAVPEQVLDGDGLPLTLPNNSHTMLVPWDLGQPAYLCIGLPGGGVQWYRPNGENSSLPQWSLFPNPTSAIAVLRSQEPAFVQLVNMRGQVLWTGSVEAQGQLTLDVSSYPVGFYAVQVIWANGEQEARLLYREP